MLAIAVGHLRGRLQYVMHFIGQNEAPPRHMRDILTGSSFKRPALEFNRIADNVVSPAFVTYPESGLPDHKTQCNWHGFSNVA